MACYLHPEFANFPPLTLCISFLYIWLRWVCTSAMPTDLEVTDNLAVTVLESIVKKGGTGYYKH